MEKQAIGQNQEKWLQALESGKFPKSCGVLRSASGGCCCLGVGCVVLEVAQKGETNSGATLFGDRRESKVAPDELIKALALRTETGELSGHKLQGRRHLTEANDDGAPFEKIAAFCREHPEAVFVEPR